MFGASQIRAYKTIMKTPRHLPRHTAAGVHLFRVIAWGAVALLAILVVSVLALEIAGLPVTFDPVLVWVIPAAMALLFCWWLADVAPTASRRLSMSVCFIASFVCLIFALATPPLEQVQYGLLLVYLAIVTRTAWRQLWESESAMPDSQTE